MKNETEEDSKNEDADFDLGFLFDGMDRKAENFEIVDEDEDEVSEEIINLSEKHENHEKQQNHENHENLEQPNNEEKEKENIQNGNNAFITPIDNSNLNQQQNFEKRGSKRNSLKIFKSNQIEFPQTVEQQKQIEEEKNEPVVKMKDKKILVNVEELEGEFKKKEKKLFGTIKCDDEDEMKALKREVEELHPRSHSTKKVQPHNLCKKMGNFGCYSEKVNSEISDLGVGTISYFKVLKVLIYCFCIISIINIPLYYVYITNNKEIISTGYRDILFKTTIGNIASSKINLN